MLAAQRLGTLKGEAIRSRRSKGRAEKSCSGSPEEEEEEEEDEEETDDLLVIVLLLLLLLHLLF